jgi:phage regulator Rha-like protein
MELTKIQLVQDFEELYEEYLEAASNERLWAKGSNTEEEIQMHEENAEHAHAIAKMFHLMAKHPDTIIKLFYPED